jgi:acetyl esterase/lipase
MHAEALSEEKVKVSWTKASTRDGGNIDLLQYEDPDRTEDSSRPLCVVFHGGGWIAGDYTVEDSFCRMLVKTLPFLVVSVHYRLSPEFQFPIPLHDCVDSLLFLTGSTHQLAFDRSRIILGGSSAGAGLACGVFQETIDEFNHSVVGLMLNIPVTCDPLHFPHERFSNRSWTEHAKAPLLSAESMTFCFDHYAPRRPDTSLISPLLASNLASFPPAVIVCAGLDPLRDQGLAFKLALEAEGVPTRYTLFERVPHGFHMMVSELPAATEALNEMVEGARWMLEIRQQIDVKAAL